MKKIKNNKYFFIVKPNLKHLLFLLYFFISLGEYLFEDIFDSESNIATPFFNVYIYIMSDFLSIIPHLIIKVRSRSKNSLISQSTFSSNNTLKYIYNDQNSEIVRKGLINILLLATTDYIAQISFVFYYIVKEEYKLDVEYLNLNSLFIFNIIFLILLSKLLLHSQFYRHHYFSSIIILLCLLVIVILDLIEIFNKKEGNKLLSFIYLILRIFKTFLYSFEDVLGKIILLKQNFTVYSLLLSKSIIQIILSIIVSISFIFIKIKDDKNNENNIYVMIRKIFENKINILRYIIYIIICFFYNIFCWQIIDKFSPNHFWLAQVFEGFGLLIVSLIKGGYFNLDSGLRLIMYLLLIILACIYNEFLIVNICDLGNDTKLFLKLKEEEDLLLSNNETDNINNKVFREDTISEQSFEIEMEKKI